MDVRQSPYWQKYLEELGWEVVNIDSIRIYSRKIPFGSIVKIPRINSPIPFSKIDKVARKQKALFVKLEVNETLKESELAWQFKKNKFEEDKWSLQPTKTIAVDLTPSEDELLKNMEKDTRYSIRRSQRESVIVEKTEDIDTFLKLHKDTAKRQKFWVSNKDSKSLWDSLPKENKTILFAKKGKEILAGAFLIFYDRVAYYYEAASSQRGRELLAPYLVVWEGLKLAKKKGCAKFDFEGIVDSRIPATKKWGGFTHFKRGFGGKEVTYLGSFIKFYNPIIKLIFFIGKLF